MDSPKVLAIRDAWHTFETGGPLATMEKLLDLSHEGVEARPYSAKGKVLRGADEIRAFFAESARDGTVLTAHAQEFAERDDNVIVRGSIRVARPDGSFAETLVRWYFHFDGPLIDSLGWEPRAGD
jgi:hypothetical protein